MYYYKPLLNNYPIPSIMKPRKSKRPECIRVPNYNSLIPLRRTVTFPHFPKICFSNVRSMVNKIDEIFASISTNLYDVVVVTETWLNSRRNRAEGTDQMTNAGAAFVPILTRDLPLLKANGF